MGTDPFRRERRIIEALFYRHRSGAPESELFSDLAAVKHDALLRGDAFEIRQDYERLSRLPSDALEAEHALRRQAYGGSRILKPLRSAS